MSAAWNAWKIRQAKQAADIDRLERELDRAGVKITSGGVEGHAGKLAAPTTATGAKAGQHGTRPITVAGIKSGPLTLSTDAAAGYARPIRVKPKADACGSRCPTSPKHGAKQDAASRPRRSLLGRLIALFWPA